MAPPCVVIPAPALTAHLHNKCLFLSKPSSNSIKHSPPPLHSLHFFDIQPSFSPALERRAHRVMRNAIRVAPSTPKDTSAGRVSLRTSSCAPPLPPVRYTADSTLGGTSLLRTFRTLKLLFVTFHGHEYRPLFQSLPHFIECATGLCL